MAERVARAVRRWHELNAPLRDGDAPDWTEELLVYQTLVGAWPIGPERLEPYLEKALREAKRNTSWVDPNARVGGARSSASRAGCSTHEPFLADFEPFAARARRGRRALVDRPARAAAHLARRARHLQRRRAAVLRARRSRQPPAGRLGRAPAPRSALARRAARRDGEAARDPRGARAAARAGRRRSRARYEPLARGRRHVRLPPRRATSSSPCRCAATSPSSTCPAGRWRNVLEGRRGRARRLPGAPARTACEPAARTECACVRPPRMGLLEPTSTGPGRRHGWQQRRRRREGARRRRRRRPRLAARRRRQGRRRTEITYEMIAERAYHIAAVRRGRDGRGELAPGRSRAAERVAPRGQGERSGARDPFERRRPPCPPSHQPVARRQRAWDHPRLCLSRGSAVGVTRRT